MESPSSQSATSGVLQRLLNWKTLRRCLIGFIGLVTLIALFYAVEDRRGRRAWEACKHDLQSQGWELNWSAFIPPAVSDEQNIYKAPKMAEWFVGRGHNELTKRLESIPKGRNGVVVAEVSILPTGQKHDPIANEAIVRFKDHASFQQAARLILEHIGPMTKDLSLGATLVAQPLGKIKPVQLILKSDQPIDAKELAGCFPQQLAGYQTNTHFRIEQPLQVLRAGDNRYNLVFVEALNAEDYLAWSEQFQPDFDLIRNALQRPCARIEGDYEHAYAIPNPNFVSIRYVARTASVRAQCQLLSGHPEQALKELTLLHNLRGLLTMEPSGKPTTLVTAMIDVAVAGLYANTVADGLRLGVWQEPQLAIIQNQLAEVNLPLEVRNGLACEMAGICNLFDTLTLSSLLDMSRTLGPLFDPSLYCLAVVPKGWLCQNQLIFTTILTQAANVYDITNNLVLPKKVDEIERQQKANSSSHSPYVRMFRNIQLPSYSRAWQVCAKNQTQVNEAIIACALERCRLAEGRYPETLEQLVPRFASQLSRDLIGGRPLSYRRIDENHFKLYSVGWNVADDGGAAELDWVWNPALL